MSASLVGSEMCIRDRNHRALSSSLRTMQARLRGRAGGGTDAATPCEAVSYTHLTLPTICSV
eukprot:1164054-Alexandrium_andersonii.AAC.1